MYWVSRHNKCIQRVNIVIGEMSEMIVGECWIKMMTLAVDTIAQGPPKRFLRPTANPRFCIGCNVA